jgi:pilus assembly protein CpaF
MLYRFVISGTERDERGRIVKVHGSHRKVGTISPELLNRLRDNGAPEAELHRLFPEVKDK